MSHVIGTPPVGQERSDAVIIGGGIGGLFTAALLARNGMRCTVLEKHHVAGGGLHTFMRYGMWWDTGMHILGGLGPGGNVERICRYLGIMDRMRIVCDSIGQANTIYCAREGHTYSIAQGREAFVQSLVREFPAEADGLHRYVGKLFELTEEVDLFRLRKSGSGFLPSHSEMFFWSADRLIAHYIHDERLRELLAFMAPLYGGIAGTTPAYVHAIINTLYIEWQGRFVGGSGQMADALCRVIADAGGEVLTRKQVTRVQLEDKCVQWVETQDGQRYTARHYVSAIHPAVLMPLVQGKGLPPAFRTRMASVPNSYSAFIVFIVLRPESVPYADHPQYFLGGECSIWDYANDKGHSWPQGMMCYTPATGSDTKWARQMIVNSIMPWREVERWADTCVGHRGPEYEAWKKQRTEMVLGSIERMCPGINGKIEHVFAASPLTIRDYLGTPEGSLYGFMQDCNNMPLSHMEVATKVPNLLLTGQNVNLHGICGVPLTAIQTSESILGQGKILDAINSMNDEESVTTSDN